MGKMVLSLLACWFCLIGAVYANEADEQAVQTLIDTYGIDNVVELVVEKRFGQMTIARGDSFTDSFGRPNKKLLSAKTILMDLEKADLSLSDFRSELESKVDKDKLRSEHLQSKSIKAPAAAASGKAKYEVVVRKGQGDKTCLAACKAKHDTCHGKVIEDSKKCKFLDSGVDKCLSENHSNMISCGAKKNDCDDTCYE